MTNLQTEQRDELVERASLNLMLREKFDVVWSTIKSHKYDFGAKAVKQLFADLDTLAWRIMQARISFDSEILSEDVQHHVECIRQTLVSLSIQTANGRIHYIAIEDLVEELIQGLYEICLRHKLIIDDNQTDES